MGGLIASVSKSKLSFLTALVFILSNCSIICLAHVNKEGSSTWGVIASTSKFWYNYRHQANALSVYHTMRRLGVPDSRIVLMLAGESACDAHNDAPGYVFNDHKRAMNLYHQNIEVDYSGSEANVHNFLRVLTGRHAPGTPRSKRLLSDASSNVLIYMSGHGGDEFLKFQDSEEVSTGDLQDALHTMRSQGRVNKVTLLVDTCQAATLPDRISEPNLLAISSSAKGENSFAIKLDGGLGVMLMDRFTYFMLEYMEKMTGDESFADLSRYLNSKDIQSTVVWKQTDRRRRSKIKLMDAFGAASKIEMGTLPSFQLNWTAIAEASRSAALQPNNQNSCFKQDTERDLASLPFAQIRHNMAIDQEASSVQMLVGFALATIGFVAGCRFGLFSFSLQSA